MTTNDPSRLTGDPPAPCAKCEPPALLAESEADVRRLARCYGTVGIVLDELDRLRESLRATCERARVAEAEVVRLSATMKLDDCRGFHDAVNEVCSCGGGGPPDCCPACEVYHAIKDFEVKR